MKIVDSCIPPVFPLHFFRLLQKVADQDSTGER